VSGVAQKLQQQFQHASDLFTQKCGEKLSLSFSVLSPSLSFACSRLFLRRALSAGHVVGVDGRRRLSTPNAWL